MTNNRGVENAWLSTQRESLAMQIILAQESGENQVTKGEK